MCAEPILNSPRSSHNHNCCLSVTHKCHICPHRDAFDAPAPITSPRLAGAQQGLAERTSLCVWREMAERSVWSARAPCCEQRLCKQRRDPEEKAPKAWEKRPRKATGSNVMREKRGKSPSVHLWHGSPLTSGCPSAWIFIRPIPNPILYCSQHKKKGSN